MKVKRRILFVVLELVRQKIDIRRIVYLALSNLEFSNNIRDVVEIVLEHFLAKSRLFFGVSLVRRFEERRR